MTTKQDYTSKKVIRLKCCCNGYEELMNIFTLSHNQWSRYVRYQLSLDPTLTCTITGIEDHFSKAISRAWPVGFPWSWWGWWMMFRFGWVWRWWKKLIVFIGRAVQPDSCSSQWKRRACTMMLPCKSSSGLTVRNSGTNLSSAFVQRQVLRQFWPSIILGAVWAKKGKLTRT